MQVAERQTVHSTLEMVRQMKMCCQGLCLSLGDAGNFSGHGARWFWRSLRDNGSMSHRLALACNG